ncbi:hypothetical protein MAELSTROM_11 [Pseudoalteromonas phage Maelstrom]|uniref:hypothetical protein n=1 Tax=Pseudoalteromonas phage Maelstrom TaxID=2065202 RepID=UPI000CA3AE5B|nr:hypothetical protein PP584_gp11 [Pseudoalteromonas phage Maelstrom]AUG84931.1 hypothetical protein MAELSTROM_11 [Pseudoalteromonas phage Maelstrom]
MIEVISEKEPVARKDHDCMACEWINNSWGNFDFTVSELKVIAKARANGYRIKRGEKYRSQTNKFEGRIYNFKAIPEIDDICLKHDVYEV